MKVAAQTHLCRLPLDLDELLQTTFVGPDEVEVDIGGRCRGWSFQASVRLGQKLELVLTCVFGVKRVEVRKMGA